MTADHQGVAVITGGASGIGFAAAAQLNATGHPVVLADINAAGLERAQAELPDPAQSATVVVDVRDEDAVANMVSVAGKLGVLKIAVNAAGVGTFGAVADHSLQEWQNVLDISLTGVLLSMKHEAQALTTGGGGTIVNVASLNGFQPAEGMAAYCVAKAGVEMLTRVAAMELGRHGIRVVGVAPGLVETPMTAGLPDSVKQAYIANTPLGRAGQPRDISDAICWLASDAASWVSGQTLLVDGAAHTREYPRLFELFGM
jgi:3-oxoacyl-[acyl-carrier protein] reductase